MQAILRSRLYKRIATIDTRHVILYKLSEAGVVGSVKRKVRTVGSKILTQRREVCRADDEILLIEKLVDEFLSLARSSLVFHMANHFLQSVIIILRSSTYSHTDCHVRDRRQKSR